MVACDFPAEDVSFTAAPGISALSGSTTIPCTVAPEVDGDCCALVTIGNDTAKARRRTERKERELLDVD
jgi:hypothetical protein